MGTLTTTDNPYDPRVDFDLWYEWDMNAGYNTCGTLARLSNTLPTVPKAIDDMLTDEAMVLMVEESEVADYVILPDLEEDRVKNRTFPLA